MNQNSVKFIICFYSSRKKNFNASSDSACCPLVAAKSRGWTGAMRKKKIISGFYTFFCISVVRKCFRCGDPIYLEVSCDSKQIWLVRSDPWLSAEELIRISIRISASPRSLPSVLNEVGVLEQRVL